MSIATTLGEVTRGEQRQDTSHRADDLIQAKRWGRRDDPYGVACYLKRTRTGYRFGLSAQFRGIASVRLAAVTAV